MQDLQVEQKIQTLNSLWNEKLSDEDKELRKQKYKEFKQWFKDHAEHIRNIKFLSREIESKGDKEIERLWKNWEKEVPKFKDFCKSEWTLKSRSHFDYYIKYQSDFKPHQWFRISEYRKEFNLEQLYLLQEEFRHRHIAWSLLKGKTYDQIEKPRNDNNPNWKKVEKYLNEYFQQLSKRNETLCANS